MIVITLLGCLICSSAIGQVNREAAERAAAAQRVGGAAPRVRPENIAQFVSIERFARLSRADQSAGLEGFYRDSAPLLANPFFEGMFSSIPADLFSQNRQYAHPGDDLDAYIVQLNAKAPEMSPSQVADTIVAVHSEMVLQLATRRRAIATLLDHRDKLAPLIDKDLSSDALDDRQRGFAVVRQLQLTEFSDKLVDILLANETGAEDARRSLMWMGDAGIVPRLLSAIEEDPAMVRQLSVLLIEPLRGKPAPAVLLKLLESTDAGVQMGATDALAESGDPALAGYIGPLLEKTDPGHKETVVEMACNLPDNVFVAVRGQILPLLSDENMDLRVRTIWQLARKHDTAAAAPLLDLLSRPTMDEGRKPQLSQALQSLAGGTITYDIHNWGPDNPRNARAIDQLRQWIARNAPAGNSLPAQ